MDNALLKSNIEIELAALERNWRIEISNAIMCEMADIPFHMCN
jgi:hypothetical protein